MEIRRREFNAKSFYAYNPFPAGWTEAKLFDMARLAKPAADIDPFVIGGIYGSQGTQEQISIYPGDCLVLRGETDARDVALMLKEQGVVVVEDIEDEEGLIRASLVALERVRKFKHDRGEFLFKSMLREAKVSKDDFDAYREVYWPYLVSQAAADVISEHMKQLKSRLAEISGKPTAEKSAPAHKKPKFIKVPSASNPKKAA